MINKDNTVQWSKNLKALLQQNEQELLFDLSMKYIQHGGIAIEIGSWLGGSAVIIGSVCKEKNARLYCIDPFSGDIHHYKQIDKNQISKFIDNIKDLPINIVSGNSLDVHNFVKDECADFIFIDGDHVDTIVKADIINYKRKLRSNGMLCGHDYGNTQHVNRAVDEVIGKNNIIVVGSIWYEKL